jgi:hypothetical protein
MGEVFPRIAVFAVVRAHGPPLPFAQIWTLLLPRHASAHMYTRALSALSSAFPVNSQPVVLRLYLKGPETSSSRPPCSTFLSICLEQQFPHVRGIPRCICRSASLSLRVRTCDAISRLSVATSWLNATAADPSTAVKGDAIDLKELGEVLR